jgi:mannose-6-phosphate isomerase-like protein (cupin superfamily)
MQYVFTKGQAPKFEKHGVSMWRFGGTEEQPENMIYQETTKGHDEEFLNTVSSFKYYVLEGNGEFIISGVSHPVVAGDVVIIPPNTPFYYKGNLKQVLVTTPSWKEGTDVHIKDIVL